MLTQQTCQICPKSDKLQSFLVGIEFTVAASAAGSIYNKGNSASQSFRSLTLATR